MPRKSLFNTEGGSNTGNVAGPLLPGNPNSKSEGTPVWGSKPFTPLVNAWLRLQGMVNSIWNPKLQRAVGRVWYGPHRISCYNVRFVCSDCEWNNTTLQFVDWIFEFVFQGFFHCFPDQETNWPTKVAPVQTSQLDFLVPSCSIPLSFGWAPRFDVSTDIS